MALPFNIIDSNRPELEVHMPSLGVNSISCSCDENEIESNTDSHDEDYNIGIDIIHVCTVLYH